MTDYILSIAIAVSVIVGFLIGKFHMVRVMSRNIDGIFHVNLGDPNEEMFKLQIDVPLEKIPGQKYLIFKVITRH